MFKFYSNPSHPSFFRNFYTLLIIFVLALATTLPEDAKANSKYAGIVIDAKTGKTLYADQADVPRYPASLTKIMTLYIVFEELQSKRMNLDTRLSISKYAATQPPSKIGIRVGHPITVRTAIRALVTKSANDVATAVAENISGSETKFAARMTRTAKSIGMKQTTFRNAHGLPNSQQRTTARDMAILGRAIQERFPNYYEFFSTRTFKFRGRTYSNHNRLLGRIKGVDGIKTGYINASGYNLVTSLKRDQRHIVAVVMGGRTGTSRNNHMIDLINRYLNKASTGSKRSYVLAASQRKTGYIHDFDQISIVKPKIKPASQLLAFAAESNNNNNKSDLQILLNKVSTGGNNTQQTPTKTVKVEENQEPITIQTTNTNQNDVSTLRVKGVYSSLKTIYSILSTNSSS